MVAIKAAGTFLSAMKERKCAIQGCWPTLPGFSSLVMGSRMGIYVPFLGRLAFRATLENNNKLA